MKGTLCYNNSKCNMVHLWYLIHSLTVYVIDNTWSGSKYDFYNNNNVTGAWERVGMEPR